MTTRPAEPVDRPLVRRALLAAILCAAAILRLGWPDSGPRGIHVDEAANAWNAQCLAYQGTDQFGQALPIFYTPAFGDNRSPLYLYLLVPFQWAFGMSPYVTRLPAALAGVLGVWLIDFIARKMFAARLGPFVGLAAAGLLAFDPWNLQLTRWGHEGSIGVTLVLVSLAGLIATVGPVLQNEEVPNGKPWRPLLAGMLAAAACYGYAAVRIYLPVLLLLIVAATYRQWMPALRDPKRKRILVAAVAGFGLILMPLVLKHLFDPEINHRATTTWVWQASDSLAQRVAKVAARYPAHFGPDFLFLHGSHDPSQAPPRGFGAQHWYGLPLMLIGLVWSIAQARRSIAARVLLLACIAYPAADLMNIHQGVNALRSFPGSWALALLSAVGLAWIAGRVVAMGSTVRRGALASIAIVFVVTQGLFFYRFFGEYNRTPQMAEVRGLAIRDACAWLKPRLENYDAVFWTQRDMSFIYAQTLVYFDWSPRRWFTEPVGFIVNNGQKWAGARLLVNYGPCWFIYSAEEAQIGHNELRKLGRPYHIAYVLRPGEVDRTLNATPAHTIVDPLGRPTLEIFEVTHSN